MTPTPPRQRLTWVRWRIVALLMGLCFLSHLNRVSMAIAADEHIMKEFSISPQRMGMVYSAFLLVYTVSMIPGGLLIDRFGARVALIVMGFGSAFFGAITGVVGLGWVTAAQVWIALLLTRSLMGLCTTPLHPGSARAVANWIPPGRRAWANGLVTGAALLGIACTYNLFGGLMDWVGWPMAFVIAGAATAGLTLLWTVYGTEHAREHPSANALEQELIAEGQSDGAEKPKGAAAWTARQRRGLLLLTLSYAAIGYFQYLFFYWIHYYFDTVLHLGTVTSRWYAGLPTLAMALTMPLGGWVSDRWQDRYGWSVGRQLVPAAGMIASAGFLGLGLLSPQPAWVVVWFTLSLGALGISEGPFWLAAVELGGARGGTAAAIINTGGNGVGLLAPMLTPALSEHVGWQWGIGLGGLIALLGAACWWGIDPEPPRGPKT